VADFEIKLQQLSSRGTPVGAEELIERIEAKLAGDPLVVVTKRREGVFMTKTDESAKTQAPGPGRGLAWGIAAFVVILAVAGLYFAFSGDDDQVVVDQTTVPTPTTVLEPETMTDVEIVEAGAAAVYSGDAATAAGMFDLAQSARWPLTDEEIATEAAYQEAIGGHVELACTEPGTSGDTFDCVYRYGNTLTDAIGFVDPGETFEVMVNDGQVVEFEFPAHSWALQSVGSFLALEGSFDGYEKCLVVAPMPPSCAAIQLETVEAWADWYQSRDDVAVVQDAMTAWYGGDCVAAASLSATPAVCSDPTDPLTLKVQYESIMEAQVSLENCESAFEAVVRCDVHYSNALNEAVGKPAAVLDRTFQVESKIGVFGWHEARYPEDAELNDSFQTFAEGGELSAEYEAAGCATSFTAECANLKMDNLDDWAAWHLANA
jgi:hypothetical protein